MWQYNYTSDYLCHWGIKGQKWGVRRYQNKDGTLTSQGRIRYYKKAGKNFEKRDALIKEDAQSYLKSSGGDKSKAREQVNEDVTDARVKSNTKYNLAKAATIAVGSIATLSAMSYMSAGAIGVAAGMGAYGYTAMTNFGIGASLGSAAATKAVTSIINDGKKKTDQAIKDIGDEIMDEIGR